MTTVFVSHPQDRLDLYFGPRALARLQTLAEVRLNPEPRELATAELIALAQGCDALIAYRQTEAPAALFAQLPQLAAFLRCAVDIRTVDVAAASAHGVLVTQASADFMAAVSEWVLAMMLELARGFGDYRLQYHQGKAPAPRMGRELRGATLGVIGYGRIARHLCPLARALGMTVLVHAPEALPADAGVRQVPFATLLADSDYVVCLAPARPDTANLMNAQAFAAMRNGACFLNASRGELVDEDALQRALESGRLAGCALDVGRAADQMPSPALTAMPQVLATPHVAALTRPATEHQSLETVSQLAALLRGELPAGAVNAEHATRWRAWPGR